MRGEYFELFDEPVVQGSVYIELERADGVRNIFDGVTLAVREVVHGVNAPCVPGSVV